MGVQEILYLNKRRMPELNDFGVTACDFFVLKTGLTTMGG